MGLEASYFYLDNVGVSESEKGTGKPDIDTSQALESRAGDTSQVASQALEESQSLLALP